MSERFPYWNACLARMRSEDFEVWGHLGCPEKKWPGISGIYKRVQEGGGGVALLSSGYVLALGGSIGTIKTIAIR